jgi:hypothetical protein
VRDNKIAAIVQIGLKKDEDLPNVPLLTELAQNDEQRKMFEFISQPIAMQQPFRRASRHPGRPGHSAAAGL